jgi:hypothetical protein
MRPVYRLAATRATLRTIAVAASVLFALTGAAAAQTVVTWTGAAGDGSYNNPANWNPPVVPINGGGDTYHVVIPDGVSVLFDVGVPDAAVSAFELGEGSSFSITDGRTLGVIDAGEIKGFIEVAGPGSAFTVQDAVLSDIDEMRVSVTNGATFSSPFTNGSYRYSHYLGTTLMNAMGPGSSIDLSSLQSIGLETAGNPNQIYDVTASDNGIIDLSGLTIIDGFNADSSDALRFGVLSGGLIDLSSLHTIDASHRVIFDVGAGQIQSLPSLTDAGHNTAFTIADNATVNAPLLGELIDGVVNIDGSGVFNTAALTDIDGTRTSVTNGGSFGSAVTDSDYRYSHHLGTTLMNATGLGSSIDLSSLQSVGLETAGNPNQIYNVTASDNGIIDLSGVTVIDGSNADSSDALRFGVQSGGTIDLSSLQTIDATHRVLFDVGEDQTQDLLSLTDAGHNTSFIIADDATVNAPLLGELIDGVVNIDDDGVFNTAAMTDIDGTRITVTNGASFGSAVTDSDYRYSHHLGTTLMNATDPGSSIDLANLQSMGLETTGNPNQIYDVTALNNGTIDLSGVTAIDGASADSSDALRFTAQSGGTIDLSSLQTIDASHRVLFDVGEDSSMSFGAINSGNPSTTVEFHSSGGHMGFGGLTVLDSWSVSLDAPGSTMSVFGDLNVDGGTMMAGDGTFVEIVNNGSFSFTSTDESNIQFTESILAFSIASQSTLEVGGLDLGALDPLNDGNFGLGQLRVGAGDYLTLVDLIDNGNRGIDGAEALYLFGIGSQDGLVLGLDAWLNIGELNTYAMVDDDWLHLNSLFTGGQTTVPFGDGFITTVPEPGALVMLGLGGLVGLRRRRAA